MYALGAGIERHSRRVWSRLKIFKFKYTVILFAMC